MRAIASRGIANGMFFRELLNTRYFGQRVSGRTLLTMGLMMYGVKDLALIISYLPSKADKDRLEKLRQVREDLRNEYYSKHGLPVPKSGSQ